MNSHTTYLVFGPSQTLSRMAPKLFEEYAPKFLYTREFDNLPDKFYVAVYEEYEKQINSSVTLTCIFENNAKLNKILLKKTGGRMGFRGSSLSEEQNVETSVMDFIFDFAKRYGLTVQEERVSDTPEED
ncbi:MAG TPA: hypothetical protein DEQ34_08235 [Balneolaceae bacterium]|nr:hypothetical protein [Balneolaceae bacterium]|tara:strand:- start:448 stop:834 length:387 start_codon:yes stop_codon:yes gene_type:complete